MHQRHFVPIYVLLKVKTRTAVPGSAPCNISERIRSFRRCRGHQARPRRYGDDLLRKARRGGAGLDNEQGQGGPGALGPADHKENINVKTGPSSSMRETRMRYRGFCMPDAREQRRLLRLKPDEVFVSSTGVIGVQLPMDRSPAASGCWRLSVGYGGSREMLRLTRF